MKLKNVCLGLWLVTAFTIVISGGPADAAGRKVSQDLPLTASIFGVDYTPDGRWITYLADIDVDERFELYVIDRQNDFSNQKVNVGGAEGAVRLVRRFENLLLYSVGAQLNNRLFASRLPLTAPVELTPLGGGVSEWLIYEAQVNASQTTVVFRADQMGTGGFVRGNLYSVALTGGPITRINAPLDSSVQTVSRFTFLNDQELIYQTGTQNGSAKLYRASLNGSSITQVSLPAGPNSDVTQYELSSSGDYVVYLGDLRVNDEQFELFATHLPTLAIEQLSEGLSIEEDIVWFDLIDDADRVVYERGNSFVLPTAVRTRLLVANDTTSLSIAPELQNRILSSAAAGRLIYTRTFNSTFDFRSAPISGGTDVSLAFPFTGSVRQQVISPQSGFVALSFTRQTSRRELFINRPNGSGLVQLAQGNFSVLDPVKFTIDDAALIFAQVDGSVQELVAYDTDSRIMRVLDRVDQSGQSIRFPQTSPTDPDEVLYWKDEQPLFTQSEIWLVTINKVFSDGYE